MRVSIIPDDGVVCVDGVCFSEIVLSALPANIHAVQWYGEFGEVEFRPQLQEGVIGKQPNAVFTDFSAYAVAVDLWSQRKVALQEAQAAEAKARAEAEAAEHARLEKIEADRIEAVRQNEEAVRLLEEERALLEATRNEISQSSPSSSS